MNKHKWINFSENKPKMTGIYVIYTHSKPKNIYLDDYSYSKTTNGKFILKSNDEKKIQWARWKYEEICDQVTEEHVIYKKEWSFFDMDNNEISDVLYYLPLPNLPKEIINES